MRGKKYDKIVNLLGHKPTSNKQYQWAYRKLFTRKTPEDWELIKIQQRRHLGHTGPANRARGYCVFCEAKKNET